VPFESPTDPGETVDFPTVIDTLIAAAFDKEMDSTLKHGWINQMYDQFLEYFRITLPFVYPWRFHRKSVKLFLYRGKFENFLSPIYKVLYKGAKVIKGAEEIEMTQQLVDSVSILDSIASKQQRNYYENISLANVEETEGEVADSFTTKAKSPSHITTEEAKTRHTTTAEAESWK